MALLEREIVTSPPERRYTEDEYLALEEAAEEKSEYVHGGIRPMSGGTDFHSIVSVNVASELRAALRGRGCTVMSSDMKVRAAGEMYYPDATVVCGPRQYYSGNHTVITNPLLVAEVLSPSTEVKDRSEKFHNYLAIDSLAVYLLVAQDEPRIEQFSRAEDGGWSYTLVAGLDGELNIAALDITLTVAEIYSEIDFADEAANE